MIESKELKFVKENMPFFSKLSETERRFLESNIICTQFSKGTLLKSGDSSCPGIILIKSGSIRVFMLSEEGREITLYRLSEEDICTLSASCILSPVSFNVQIIAETDVKMYIIPAHVFAKISSQNVYVENFAYKTTITRFSNVMNAMEQLLFTKIDVRLARFLLSEDEQRKSNGSLKITQEELAQYLGTAREVVSRALKKLQTNGCLEQSRGIIHIIDFSKLKKSAALN